MFDYIDLYQEMTPVGNLLLGKIISWYSRSPFPKYARHLSQHCGTR